MTQLDFTLTAMELNALNIAEAMDCEVGGLFIADYTEYLDGYQRHATDAKVDEYLGIELVDGTPLGFQAWLFDRILVGRRADGSLWVIDGGHRLKIAKRIGRKQIAAWVIESTGEEFEAKLFKLKNKLTRTQISAGDEIRSEMVGGWDDTYSELRDLVMQHGYNWWITSHDKKRWDNDKPFIKLTKALKAAMCEGTLGKALTLFRTTGWTTKDNRFSRENQRLSKTQYVHGFCTFLLLGDYKDDVLKTIMEGSTPKSVEGEMTAAELSGGGRVQKYASGFQRWYDVNK